MYVVCRCISVGLTKSSQNAQINEASILIINKYCFTSANSHWDKDYNSKQIKKE